MGHPFHSANLGATTNPIIGATLFGKPPTPVPFDPSTQDIDSNLGIGTLWQLPQPSLARAAFQSWKWLKADWTAGISIAMTGGDGITVHPISQIIPITGSIMHTATGVDRSSGTTSLPLTDTVGTTQYLIGTYDTPAFAGGVASVFVSYSATIQIGRWAIWTSGIDVDGNADEESGQLYWCYPVSLVLTPTFTASGPDLDPETITEMPRDESGGAINPPCGVTTLFGLTDAHYGTDSTLLVSDTPAGTSEQPVVVRFISDSLTPSLVSPDSTGFTLKVTGYDSDCAELG